MNAVNVSLIAIEIYFTIFSSERWLHYLDVTKPKKSKQKNEDFMKKRNQPTTNTKLNHFPLFSFDLYA